jgi:hypothetical protein
MNEIGDSTINFSGFITTCRLVSPIYSVNRTDDWERSNLNDTQKHAYCSTPTPLNPIHAPGCLYP